MPSAIFWGFPDGRGAEAVVPAELGDGDGVAAAAACAAARSAASLAARRSAARSARTLLTPSAATSRRAAPVSRTPVSRCAPVALVPGCALSIASNDDEFPASTPEAVIPATTATGMMTPTPAITTVILDNLRLCRIRLRFFLCRADTNYLWSGALCARLHPGHCRPMTRRPARAEAR